MSVAKRTDTRGVARRRYSHRRCGSCPGGPPEPGRLPPKSVSPPATGGRRCERYRIPPLSAGSGRFPVHPGVRPLRHPWLHKGSHPRLGPLLGP
jgi:hypothetical protein